MHRNLSNNFKILISEVYIQNYRKISDSIVRFVSIDRCDFIGTEFCKVEYNYNTINKTVEKITKTEKKHTKSLQTRDDTVYIFPTLTAAKQENQDSISCIIPPHSNIKVTAFIDNKGFYYIEYNGSFGWIRMYHLYELGGNVAD